MYKCCYKSTLSPAREIQAIIKKNDRKRDVSQKP